MAEAMDEGSAGTGNDAGEPETMPLSEIPLAERPTCVICLGMAGSGKTTFVQVN